MKKTALILFVLTIVSCQEENSNTLNLKEVIINEIIVNEVYQTERNEPDNIDSPAFWSDETNYWVIATAKEGDALVVTDANNGSFIQRVGTEGQNHGELDRPNGVWVIDDLCIVVERDNRRVQVFTLPDFKSVGFIGDTFLIKPYGLSVHKTGTTYNMYVTDNYETADEQIPSDDQLDKRVHHYTFSIQGDSLTWNLVKCIGETSGEGVLSVVESILADTLYNHLFLSEEDMEQSGVKVYNLEGEFTGNIIGEGYFTGQVEGLALWQNSDGSGYLVATDQSYEKNRFHIFQRKTFEYVGTFAGSKTTNTDGIWLTQESFGRFEKGAFFAIHNDGNVSAFDWKEIADKLNLSIN